MINLERVEYANDLKYAAKLIKINLLYSTRDCFTNIIDVCQYTLDSMHTVEIK